MPLNWEDAEVRALASELARLRHVPLSQAVRDALRNELARERRKGTAEGLLEIGKRCAAHMQRPISPADHAALLHDRHGLP